jgi:IS605 OrfB family transposase
MHLGGEHRWRSFAHRLKIRKTFKYRLYPNRKQRESLRATLEGCAAICTTTHSRSAEIIDNPRYYQRAQKELRRKQRHVSRWIQRSSGGRKACRLAAKLHRHVLNQRNDFQHKVSRELVNHYGRIVVEDLNVQGLAGGRLAKSVHDAAWSSFIAKLLDRAESADRVLGKVDPRGTSQPGPCGKPAPKKLWNRLHKCSWGLNTTRDHASALEILGRGLRRRTETPGRAGVALEAPRLSDGA